jgi:hypothetical protein
LSSFFARPQERCVCARALALGRAFSLLISGFAPFSSRQATAEPSSIISKRFCVSFLGFNN